MQSCSYAMVSISYKISSLRSWHATSVTNLPSSACHLSCEEPPARLCAQLRYSHRVGVGFLQKMLPPHLHDARRGHHDARKGHHDARKGHHDARKGRHYYIRA